MKDSCNFKLILFANDLRNIIIQSFISYYIYELIHSQPMSHSFFILKNQPVEDLTKYRWSTDFKQWYLYESDFQLWIKVNFALHFLLKVQKCVFYHLCRRLWIWAILLYKSWQNVIFQIETILDWYFRDLQRNDSLILCEG